MNYLGIKEEIEKHINSKVRIVINGMRNKREILIGKIKCTYPNIFTISSKEINRSFSYTDVLIGDVIIEYL